MSFNYPKTAQVEQTDDYHGIEVKDPYRWLEDPDSEATKAWVEAQNQVTFRFLENIPERETIKERLTQLWDYEKYGIPIKKGERYFYFKNDGLQNQSVLYTLNQLEEEPKILLDPNQFSEDGTIALSGIAISDNGQFLAYGISKSGSDWQEWQVRNVETGEDFSDHLQWVKFSSATWTKDNEGFFYSRYDAPPEGKQLEQANYYQKLYYHRLGTEQSDDSLIYERPNEKEWMFDADVTEDGKYLIISVSQGTDPKNLVFYQNLEDSQSDVKELISDFTASFSFIEYDGSIFWFRTDYEAPKGRLIGIDLTQPEPDNWQEIVPETENTLEGVSILNHQFILDYLQNARSRLQIHAFNGTYIQDIELPGIGSVGGFNGKREDTETFYAYTSFTTPTTIYRYNLETGESTIFRQPTVDFNPSNYETRQVFYRSKDGTHIPMFITHKKGLLLDGTNPTLLYGYGGFNISLTPSFSVSRLVWMEMGGVYAVPNLRGGGEYGEAWHQAGTKHNKQNVFDDFIAAAEWLIDHRYTSTQKLAISGGSNGGLLVGACMTQRPDLFGAALPAVGVMDMLRFHKFTIGWAWCSDYGSPDHEEEFTTLYHYSPLHNLKAGTTYPSTLITTADHDDRVVPAHSFKFAAALQAAHAGENPVLIRIETKAGHGAGKPTSKRIEEVADQIGFLTAVI